MTLKEQLMEDMKAAMRAGDALTRDTIRFLQAEVKNFELDNGEQDDAGVQKIAASQVKKIKEGIEEFKKGGRDDLIPDEEAKIVVLTKYLPVQLSDDELRTLTQKVIDSLADTSNRGQVMGAVMKEVAGRADGGRVATVVGEILS